MQISSPLLEHVLRTVRRRYRVPVITSAVTPQRPDSPSVTLAVVIERVREVLDVGGTPDEAVKRTFLDALARLIQEAMRPDRGDPAFQAAVLRHQSSTVREYASLAAHADRDRREIRAAVNAIAHPEKQRRMPPGPLQDALERLHALAGAAAWHDLADVARRILSLPEDIQADASTTLQADATMMRRLQQLLDSPALKRLPRQEALASDDQVQQYQSLWDRQGPRAGSGEAIKQGSASQQRGAVVEAQAAQALQALAARLNAAHGDETPYRVVTSMRASPSLPNSAEYAKSEWDAVLLRQAQKSEGEPIFDICLLVEAKASVDAATTDLPRLLRGLRLLSSAERDIAYPFETQQGVISIRGSSLMTCATDAVHLANHVLYCCDAPAETSPRLLSATSRMQLLSAEGSVTFASHLMLEAQRVNKPPLNERSPHQQPDTQRLNTEALEAVWNQLLHSPRWETVRQQYPLLRQVRNLMVHVDDLFSSVNQIATDESMSISKRIQ